MHVAQTRVLSLSFCHFPLHSSCPWLYSPFNLQVLAVQALVGVSGEVLTGQAHHGGLRREPPDSIRQPCPLRLPEGQDPTSSPTTASLCSPEISLWSLMTHRIPSFLCAMDKFCLSFYFVCSLYIFNCPLFQ